MCVRVCVSDITCGISIAIFLSDTYRANWSGIFLCYANYSVGSLDMASRLVMREREEESKWEKYI